MARQRRGPEIRGTLGTLLRTTLEQAGVVRDAIERGAREGKTRLDEARAGRKRRETLAELGELVLELIRSGEIDLAELPEAAALVKKLDEMDEGEETAPAAAAAAKPRSRERFDTRGGGGEDGTVSSGAVWRPKVVEKKGGIQFDEGDEDLASYMHPDDVPPKGGGGGG